MFFAGGVGPEELGFCLGSDYAFSQVSLLHPRLLEHLGRLAHHGAPAPIPFALPFLPDATLVSEGFASGTLTTRSFRPPTPTPKSGGQMPLKHAYTSFESQGLG